MDELTDLRFDYYPFEKRTKQQRRFDCYVTALVSLFCTNCGVHLICWPFNMEDLEDELMITNI